MIKLFKNIRRKLLSQSNLKKYLLYAVGEIILVVTGILIALALNNWNSERIAANQNRELLRKLVADIERNIERVIFLENHIDLGTLNKNVVDSMLIIVTRGIEESDLEFMTRKNPIFNVFMYNLHSTTFEEMKNTGTFYSLGTDSLISAIEAYYKLCEREQYYNLAWGERVEKLGEKCSSGWADFVYLHGVNSNNAIKTHPWIYDSKSTNYINLRRYILEASMESGYTADRFERIKKRSKELKEKLNN